MKLFDRRERIHFLHIGKNAGTQIAYVISQVNERAGNCRIVKHGHRVRLRDLPPRERYFFSIRSPDTRFVSAFYSRKRKGQPRRYSEWSDEEARAFAEFAHANDLAESLFAPGGAGRNAMCAIKSISHCSMNQIDWFDCCGYALELRPPVAILRQEQLAGDLAKLHDALAITVELRLSEDAAESHRTDYSETPPLSERARENLYRWYAQDFEFYARCVGWIEAQEV